MQLTANNSTGSV